MFDESKHPRADDGKFTDGAGGTHKATPAEEKRLSELGINPESVVLSKQEYAVLRSEVMRKNAAQKGKIRPMNFAFTSNYFYIYSTRGGDGFLLLKQFNIEEDRDKINDWLEIFGEQL